jgi:DNA-binding NtrC family response regulator
MHTVFTILIADRNPNVRDYLRRELKNEGYQTILAENCREVIQMINTKIHFDMIIIDPDLPDVEEKELFFKLQGLRPHTAIVIHTLASQYLDAGSAIVEACFIEKDGNSIDRLKQVIAMGHH